MPEGLDKERETLRQFVLDSVQLDAFLDARARDIEFIEAGRQVLYSPDQSTWGAFFFPVKDGQAHEGRDGIIPGFAEVFLEADRSPESDPGKPFLGGSSLTVDQATGMLGKVLIDAIFAPFDESEIAPDFFLTEESKAGLNEAILAINRARENNVKNPQVQRQVAKALRNLSETFEKAEEETLPELFAKSPNDLKNGGILGVLLDDENPVNINERVETYNRIGFVDWAYIKGAVEGGAQGDEVLHFSRSDVREYERLVAEFFGILAEHLPRTASETKIASMSEILALNAIAERAGRKDIRFSYLTNAPRAIRDFDRFAWHAGSDSPLRPIRGKPDTPTVSSLFVRSPLCFLHDIELSPETDDGTSALKAFMDSIVPQQLYDKNRLSIGESSENRLQKALKRLGEEKPALLALYAREVGSFYDRWAEKKAPWVNDFLYRKGEYWAEGLKLFAEEGFLEFWRGVNRDFARHSWQLGIYVAMMMDESAARAAPLTFIDCDRATNRLLSDMQAELARGDIEEFQGKISEFIDRPAERQSEERKRYFDSLVNAVLFMFSNQFETSLLHTETACDLAMKSSERDVTGREAFYLRSHLMRVTAKNREEIEMARKLMLIARSKLEIDNESLPAEAKVSTIRFDVEDWSRRIVLALANYFDFDPKERVGKFSVGLVRDYLSFVRRATETGFFGLSGDERESLFERISERMRFNFTVLAVTLDSSMTYERSNSKRVLADIVEEWNRDFGKGNEYLSLNVSENAFDHASTIERAYLLALAAGAPTATFVDDDFDAAGKVEYFFGEDNRKSVELARTSFVDKERYRSLGNYCRALMKEWEAAG